MKPLLESEKDYEEWLKCEQLQMFKAALPLLYESMKTMSHDELRDLYPDAIWAATIPAHRWVEDSANWPRVVAKSLMHTPTATYDAYVRYVGHQVRFALNREASAPAVFARKRSPR